MSDKAAEVIRQLVSVMRRSDPEYCDAHGIEPCFEEEWDAAMEAAEDWLEDQQGNAR